MKPISLNLFDTLYISRSLIAMAIIVLGASCEKEDYNPKKAYSFQKYSFNGSIECYNPEGNRFDSLSYMYSRSNLIFSEEFQLPYDNIEIGADRTVKLYYTEENVLKIKNGTATFKNDSLYFYSESNVLLFAGLVDDNQIRVPGCGYIYYDYSTNGLVTATGCSKTIKLGISDPKDLLKKFPHPVLAYYTMCVQRLYFQKFDVVYEIKSK